MAESHAVRARVDEIEEEIERWKAQITEGSANQEVAEAAIVGLKAEKMKLQE